MTLLSDSELVAVQSVAQSGMVTPVAIYHGVLTKTDNGQKLVYPASPDLTVNGWLTEITPNSMRLGVSDGRTTLSETHRLFLPVGTDCRSGDKVIVKGTTFIAQHTNAEDTYPAAFNVALRTLL